MPHDLDLQFASDPFMSFHVRMGYEEFAPFFFFLSQLNPIDKGCKNEMAELLPLKVNMYSFAFKSHFFSAPDKHG